MKTNQTTSTPNSTSTPSTFDEALGLIVFGIPLAIIAASAVFGILGIVWVLLSAVASVVGLV